MSFSKPVIALILLTVFSVISCAYYLLRKKISTDHGVSENKSPEIEHAQQHKDAHQKKGKIKDFLSALLLAIIFLVISVPFLLEANNLTDAEKTSIGQINLLRIIIIFGSLSILTTAFYFIKQRKNKLVIIFVWIFWFLGTIFVIFISNKNGGIQLSSNIFENSAPLMGIVPITPFVIWFFSIYYCRRVAMRLKKNIYIAIISATILSILAVPIYFIFSLVYSYQKKKKEDRIKILKLVGVVTIFLLLISAGAVYYLTGTPEYSLYKLRQSIKNNDTVGIERHLDFKSIIEKDNDLGALSQEELVVGLNKSFWEIKEENPDKSKNADAYITTGLAGNKLEIASVTFSQNSDPLISLKLNPEGTEDFKEITKRNIGKTITLFLGGQLVSSPNVEHEIENGKVAFNSKYSRKQSVALVERINNEKTGMINGLKIIKKTIDGNSAKILIGIISEMGTGINTELSMERMRGNYWKIVQINKSTELAGVKLPAAEGEKLATFKWKYKGKNYSLDKTLYDSYYQFYNSLPGDAVFNGESAIGWAEKNNDIFINKIGDDKSLEDLAQSLKALADENTFDENQLAEFVASFVQTIPYDTEKFNLIKAGIRAKIYYSYEVLFNNKGVCSDKSFMAYSLLRDLGYGVAIFLFPEDQHMAMGIKCPLEYSSYGSGYCFLESTVTGNRIGIIPELMPSSNIATSNIEIGSYGNDQGENEYNPLGRVEIINVIDGKEYTGIINTIALQKEIDGLRASLNAQDNTLNALDSEIKNTEEDLRGMEDNLRDMEKKLTNLAKNEDYNGYAELYSKYEKYYSKYKKAFSEYKKDFKDYDNKIEIYNQTSNKHNRLLNSFYQ